MGSGGFIHTGYSRGKAGRSRGSAGTVGLAHRLQDEGRRDCRVEPRSEKHGVASVGDLPRPRWHSQGAAGGIKVLPSHSPFSPTSLLGPPAPPPTPGPAPLTKSNQEVRGPGCCGRGPCWPASQAQSTGKAGGQQSWTEGTVSTPVSTGVAAAAADPRGKGESERTSVLLLNIVL